MYELGACALQILKNLPRIILFMSETKRKELLDANLYLAI